MKIAYLGNFDGVPFSTENDVRVAFESLGHEIIQLQENRTSVEDIRNTQFDFLLVTGTWASQPLDEWLGLMNYLAKKRIPSATYHLDTFWITNRGGRKWWLEPMFHTSKIFTADGDWQLEWELIGKNHIWLPPAVRHTAVKIGSYREEYACDLAFVGSNGQGYHEDIWTYRKELVDNLREMARRNGWRFKNPGGDDPKIERGDDMNDFYASAKVTVGDSLCVKKEKARYWSDRVPEATGRGGFLIMPEIEYLNKEGWDLITYKWGNWDNLEGVIKEAMSMEQDEREHYIHFNMDKTANWHTYKNRANEILKWLK